MADRGNVVIETMTRDGVYGFAVSPVTDDDFRPRKPRQATALPDREAKPVWRRAYKRETPTLPVRSAEDRRRDDDSYIFDGMNSVSSALPIMIMTGLF